MHSKLVWGAFPFPATFGNPTTATFEGNIASTGGFIPISNANPTTHGNKTTAPLIPPLFFSPSGNVVTAPACTFRSSNTRIRCDITITIINSLNPPTISISGVLDNIGLKFYDGLDVTKTTDLQVTTRSGSATVTSRTITHSLNTTGSGTVTFTGALANTGVVRIEYRRVPPLSNWVLAATNHYLIANNWHHLMYYKVAQPFLPGGSLICVPHA